MNAPLTVGSMFSGVGMLDYGLHLAGLEHEWLMGLPDGWSDPGCLLSATEFKSSSGCSPAVVSSSGKAA